MKNIHPSKLLLAEVWFAFIKFGPITNIQLDERKQACTVHFKSIVGAEAAASKPILMIGDHKVDIIYNIGNQSA